MEKWQGNRFYGLVSIPEKIYSKKVKSQSDCKKMTFNITYYSVFQKVWNILQELQILLTPDQELKKVFQDILVAGLRNDKSVKDHLVGAKLPNVDIPGRFESCGKKKCQVCDFIYDKNTFSTNHCGKTFKIQSRILDCNS